MNGKLKVLTLGCKVNQYETQLVREGLLSAGYLDAAADEPADLCVVNTCTVTADGDAKSRQAIRRMGRENPRARIVVMGCYATRAPDEIRELPGVVEVVTDKREIPDLLGRHGVIDPPAGISGQSGRTRAFVKIQDGCLLRCSYCIIPHVRPNMYSRPEADVVAEIRRLVENGFREVVLTGIHLGHYGVDFNANRPRSGWTRLSTLLERLMQIDGDFRVRLSSIEATEVTRDLLRVMAEHRERICPHLHVCLQSGSDSVLRRMRRRWSARQIVDRCQAVAAVLDRPGFSTDVIVGFPGETDLDFQQTLDVCETVGFHRIHGFPFSRRRGTPAAEMADQVSPEVRSLRCGQLAEAGQAIRTRYLQTLVGQPLKVLVEDHTPGEAATGISCRYVTCRIAPGDLPGEPSGISSRPVSLRKSFVPVTASEVLDGPEGAILGCQPVSP